MSLILRCAWCLVVAAAIMPFGLTFAVASADAEAKIEAARKKLDEAAAELSRAVATAYAHPDPKGERAFLGILLDHEGDESGVRLTGVTPGGGAASAGLAAGDTLIRMNDVALVGQPHPEGTLMEAMEQVKPGDFVHVVYVRDGKEHAANIKTTGMFRSALASIEPKLAPWIEEQGLRAISGFMHDPERSTAILIDLKGDLAPYFGVISGVLVLHVPAEEGGLKAGDVILAIDSKVPANANDAQASIFAGDRHKEVRVRRQNREEVLSVDPSAYDQPGPMRVFVYRFDTDPAAPPPPVPPPAKP